MLKKPEKLSRGDSIGIVVPSSPVKEPFRSQGLEKVRELGYVPVEAPEIMSGHDFLAKAAEHSLQDIQAFWNDPDIKAIWAARGGYGSNHLLPLVNRLEMKHPKVVIGSSDVSYLLWRLMGQFNMVVFYGPMVYAALAENRANTDQLRAVLTGAYSKMRIPGQVLIPGKVRAAITGGCLSNLVSLLGTPFFPAIDDRVLLLEDRGEKPYRLDRMLWQLSESGVFSRIRGLILGEFPDCFRNEQEHAGFLSRVRAMLKGLDVPVVHGVPVGHAGTIHTVPLGISVDIDTDDFPGFSFDEKGVV